MWDRRDRGVHVQPTLRKIARKEVGGKWAWDREFMNQLLSNEEIVRAAELYKNTKQLGDRKNTKDTRDK
jgi:hypothetical protein